MGHQRLLPRKLAARAHGGSAPERARLRGGTLLLSKMSSFSQSFDSDSFVPTHCLACGMRYLKGLTRNDFEHEEWHDCFENGPPVGLLRNGVHFVQQGTRSNARMRDLVVKAESLARRDVVYDIPMFCSYVEVNVDSTLAGLFVRDRRVVGLAVTRMKVCSAAAQIASFSSGHDGFYPSKRIHSSSERRRTIDLIWVHGKHRRQGIMRSLVSAMAERNSIKLEDFAHLVPLSDPALKFWAAEGLRRLFVVG